LAAAYGCGIARNHAFVDGVYVAEGSSAPLFLAARSPGAGELQALVQQMAERIGQLLEKRGLIERDAQSAWLSGESVQAGSLDELIGHCITWRIAAGQRAKLERLCRYVSRAPLAQDRLTLSASGQVCYGFTTPWRDGTTHVVLKPLDFIARVAARVRTRDSRVIMRRNTQMAEGAAVDQW
jgi:hypothetical protein